MLARKLPPPATGDGPGGNGGRRRRARGEGAGPAHRRTGRDGHPPRHPKAELPSRGPQGPVRWFERPAPGGDELLWEAVVRVHVAKLDRRVPTTMLVRRLAAREVFVRRETLSRVLNGTQATSWPLVEALAEILAVDLTDLIDRRER